MPVADELDARLDAVLHVLYLIFNEGYAATSGAALIRADLADEAIRLGRVVHLMLPAHAEAAGLLALMLLTDARRAARTDADRALIPLDRQDRARWDRAAIAEGTALVEAAFARNAVGPFQLQAAIAALHDLARLPNREIALATAEVVQRRLGVDLGLPHDQPLPPVQSRVDAEVARRVLTWAVQYDVVEAGAAAPVDSEPVYQRGSKEASSRVDLG